MQTINLLLMLHYLSAYISFYHLATASGILLLKFL